MAEVDGTPFLAEAITKSTFESPLTAQAWLAGSFSASAIIARVVWEDDFSRTVSGHIGSIYRDWPDPQHFYGPADLPLNQPSIEVNGAWASHYWKNNGRNRWFLNDPYYVGYPSIRQGILQFDFLVYNNPNVGYYYSIDSAFDPDHPYPVEPEAYDNGGGTWEFWVTSGFFYDWTPDDETWYTAKVYYDATRTSGPWRLKVWRRSDAEPDWMVTFDPSGLSPFTSVWNTYIGFQQYSNTYPTEQPSYPSGIDNVRIVTFDGWVQTWSYFAANAWIKTQFVASAWLAGHFSANARIAGHFRADAMIFSKSIPTNAWIAGRFTIDAILLAHIPNVVIPSYPPLTYYGYDSFSSGSQVSGHVPDKGPTWSHSWGTSSTISNGHFVTPVNGGYSDEVGFTSGLTDTEAVWTCVYSTAGEHFSRGPFFRDGGNNAVGVEVRNTDATTWTVRLRVYNSDAILATTTITTPSGSDLIVRAWVTGRSPTRYRVMAWAKGTPMPQVWNIDINDTDAGRQNATGLMTWMGYGESVAHTIWDDIYLEPVWPSFIPLTFTVGAWIKGFFHVSAESFQVIARRPVGLNAVSGQGLQVIHHKPTSAGVVSTESVQVIHRKPTTADRVSTESFQVIWKELRFYANAWVQREVSHFGTVSAEGWLAGRFSADAVKTGAGVYADAWIKPPTYFGVPFTIDAQVAGWFTVNAEIFKAQRVPGVMLFKDTFSRPDTTFPPFNLGVPEIGGAWQWWTDYTDYDVYNPVTGYYDLNNSPTHVEGGHLVFPWGYDYNGNQAGYVRMNDSFRGPPSLEHKGEMYWEYQAPINGPGGDGDYDGSQWAYIADKYWYLGFGGWGQGTWWGDPVSTLWIDCDNYRGVSESGPINPGEWMSFRVVWDEEDPNGEYGKFRSWRKGDPEPDTWQVFQIRLYPDGIWYSPGDSWDGFDFWEGLPTFELQTGYYSSVLFDNIYVWASTINKRLSLDAAIFRPDMPGTFGWSTIYGSVFGTIAADAVIQRTYERTGFNSVPQLIGASCSGPGYYLYYPGSVYAHPRPPGDIKAGDIIYAWTIHHQANGYNTDVVPDTGFVLETGGTVAGSNGGYTFKWYLWKKVATASEPATYNFSRPLGYYQGWWTWFYVVRGETSHAVVATPRTDTPYVVNIPAINGQAGQPNLVLLFTGRSSYYNYGATSTTPPGPTYAGMIAGYYMGGTSFWQMSPPYLGPWAVPEPYQSYGSSSLGVSVFFPGHLGGFTLDAWLESDVGPWLRIGSFSADAQRQARVTRTFTASAQVLGIKTAKLGRFNAFANVTLYPRYFSVDAVIVGGAFTVKAWIFLRPTGSFTANALVVGLTGTQLSSFPVDAQVGHLAEPFGFITVNAYFEIVAVEVDGDGFDVDAFVVGTNGTPFFADAYLIPREHLASLRADAWVAGVGERLGALSVDAFVLSGDRSAFMAMAYIGPLHFTVDAKIGRNFYADAVIRPYITGSFEAAAAILGLTYSAFTTKADAWIRQGSPVIWWTTADAWLTLTRKFAADASIVGTANRTVDLLAYIWKPQTFTVDAVINAQGGFSADAQVRTVGGGLGIVTLDAYLRGISVVIYPPDGGAPTDPVGNPPPPTRSYRVAIEFGFTTGDYIQYDASNTQPIRTWLDYTDHILWRETSFTQRSKATPGDFVIALDGAFPEFVGGEEVHLSIDELRQFGGYVLTLERTTYFVDGEPKPKTILHGVDYNVLFDRTVMYNNMWERVQLAKGGHFYGPYRPPIPWKRGTLDKDLINDLTSYMILPHDVDFQTNVEVVGTPAPVMPWTFETGESWRQVMQSMSMITTAIWFLDAYKSLHNHARTKVTAPFPITDTGGGISCRELLISRDIGPSVTDTIVWGTAARTKETPSVPKGGAIIYSHLIADKDRYVRYWQQAVDTMQGYVDTYEAIPPGERTPTQQAALTTDLQTLKYDQDQLWLAEQNPAFDYVSHYGRWQTAEFRDDIWHQEYVNRRAGAILDRYEGPVVHGSCVIWEPGFQAGQVAQLKSNRYGVDIAIPIRELTISFPLYKGYHQVLPQYRLAFGYDPEAPWNVYDPLPYEGYDTSDNIEKKKYETTIPKMREPVGFTAAAVRGSWHYYHPGSPSFYGSGYQSQRTPPSPQTRSVSFVNQWSQPIDQYQYDFPGPPAPSSGNQVGELYERDIYMTVLQGFPPNTAMRLTTRMVIRCTGWPEYNDAGWSDIGIDFEFYTFDPSATYTLNQFNRSGYIGPRKTVWKAHYQPLDWTVGGGYAVPAPNATYYPTSFPPSALNDGKGYGLADPRFLTPTFTAQSDANGRIGIGFRFPYTTDLEWYNLGATIWGAYEESSFNQVHIGMMRNWRPAYFAPTRTDNGVGAPTPDANYTPVWYYQQADSVPPGWGSEMVLVDSEDGTFSLGASADYGSLKLWDRNGKLLHPEKEYDQVKGSFQDYQVKTNRKDVWGTICIASYLYTQPQLRVQPGSPKTSTGTRRSNSRMARPE